MRTLTLTLCLALAGGAAAADLPIADAPILPGDVVSACLSPSLTERVSGLSWRVLTPEAWGKSIDVGEAPDTLTLAQDGAAHPNGWVRTRVTVTQAPALTGVKLTPSAATLEVGENGFTITATQGSTAAQAGLKH